MLLTWVPCRPLPSSCPGQLDGSAPTAELKASQLVEQLVDGAARHVRSFGATDVALVLDGLARLRIQPPAVLLDALAEQVIHSIRFTSILGLMTGRSFSAACTAFRE